MVIGKLGLEFKINGCIEFRNDGSQAGAYISLLPRSGIEMQDVQLLHPSRLHLAPACERLLLRCVPSRIIMIVSSTIRPAADGAIVRPITIEHLANISIVSKALARLDGQDVNVLMLRLLS